MKGAYDKTKNVNDVNIEIPSDEHLDHEDEECDVEVVRNDNNQSKDPA
jgi:hypothetical protein